MKALILLVFFANILCSQDNFEGVITYKRISDTQNIAFEKYYIKGQKIKLLSEFHNPEGMRDYVRFYDFDKHPNKVFKQDPETAIYEWKAMKAPQLDSIVYNGIEEDIMDHPCKKYVVYHTPHIVFQSESATKQEIWVSDEYEFKVENTVNAAPYMINLFVEGISLKMKEYSTNSLFNGYSYTRELIDISEMVLDERIFDLSQYEDK